MLLTSFLAQKQTANVKKLRIARMHFMSFPSWGKISCKVYCRNINSYKIRQKQQTESIFKICTFWRRKKCDRAAVYFEFNLFKVVYSGNTFTIWRGALCYCFYSLYGCPQVVFGKNWCGFSFCFAGPLRLFPLIAGDGYIFVLQNHKRTGFFWLQNLKRAIFFSCETERN